MLKKKNNYDNYGKKFRRSSYASFYTGVGYGKAEHGEKLLGFNSDNDRKNFERGTKAHKDYFVTHIKQTKPKGLFARIVAWFRA